MKKDTTNIGFELLLIKLEQFATFESNYTSKKEATLETSIQFKLDKENKQIAVFMGFEFIEGQNVFLKIAVSCHFKIDNASWIKFIHEKTKIEFPNSFLAHLAMITTGTTRGVLFTKTESTVFSQFILPTVNVAEMIKEDIVFNL